MQFAPVSPRALGAEPDFGLLLPCSVVLYGDSEGTVVAALDPLTMVELTGNPGAKADTNEARARLERDAAALAARLTGK